MRKIACALLVGAGLVFAGPAQAGSVECNGSQVTFRADPGESNRVELRLEDTVFTLADRGADLTSVGSCPRVSANEIRIEAGGFTVDADTGDGDDTLTSVRSNPESYGLPDLQLRVDPGPGDDVVHTAGGDTHVKTGNAPDGADQISLNGSDFQDTIASDIQDAVSYAGRSTPVRVSPDGVANDGEQGEGDDISGGLTVEGTPGNDVLQAGNGNWGLIGGAGDDQLLGGPGDSGLDGGAGSDVLRGGPGTDGVGYYSTATRGVSVTPDNVPNDGQPGEGDNVGSDIEDVGGTDFNDHIVGTDAPNLILGGAGDDTIDARGGKDILHGDDGNDVLLGGGGNDKLGALEGDGWPGWGNSTWTDQVDCGEGSDYVWSNPSDRLSANCEGGAKYDGPWGRSQYCSFPEDLPGGIPTIPIPADLCADEKAPPGAVVASTTAAVVSLSCPRRAPRRCKGVASLSTPSEPPVLATRRARKAVVLGSRRVSIKRGRRVRVRVPLTRAGRRIVAARKSLPATVTLRYRVRRGHSRSLRSRILLLAGK